jgi:glycosyltransferase A (GT-A) superfamily protein (DUF2064 family)
VQVSGNLGDRLSGAFAELLVPGSRVVIFGADSPYLSPGAIELALGTLDRADAVIAPARDGGYSLIGLRRPAPELFEGVDWGSERVLEQTLERASGIGLHVQTLDPIDDVDDPADLCRLVAWAATDTSPRAPRTREALRRLGFLPDA